MCLPPYGLAGWAPKRETHLRTPQCRVSRRDAKRLALDPAHVWFSLVYASDDNEARPVRAKFDQPGVSTHAITHIF
jgi:hypothetical protein